MNIEAIMILQSETGMPLFSSKSRKIQGDMFSPLISIIRSYFSSMSLGGISSFTTEDYMVYTASVKNVLTSVVVNINKSTEKYYSLAYELSNAFYNNFKHKVSSTSSLIDTDYYSSNFEPIFNEILDNFKEESQHSEEIIRLYEVDSEGSLNLIDFINKDQLYSKQLLVVLNLVTKEFVILENDQEIPDRKLFFANREITNLNQKEFKSEFSIRNFTTPWGCEQIIDQVSAILDDKKINQ